MAEKNKKRSRAGTIVQMKKQFDEVEKACMNYNGNINYLISAESILKKKIQRVTDLSKEIADEIEDANDFQKELEEAIVNEVQFTEKLTVLRDFIARKKEGLVTYADKEEKKIKKEKVKNVKLPVFEIKKFQGTQMIGYHLANRLKPR